MSDSYKIECWSHDSAEVLEGPPDRTYWRKGFDRAAKSVDRQLMRGAVVACTLDDKDVMPEMFDELDIPEKN